MSMKMTNISVLYMAFMMGFKSFLYTRQNKPKNLDL